jgi:hypothetical protein
MATEDDEALLAEIDALADRAEAAKPRLMDSLAVASELGRRLDHRTIHEIRDQVRRKFQACGLFLADD